MAPIQPTLAVTFEGVGLSLWDVSRKAKITDLVPPTQRINAVAFSADGKAIAASSLEEGAKSSLIRIWSVTTWKEWCRFRTPNHVRDLVFSPDRETLALVSWDGDVDLWTLSEELRDLSLERTADSVLRGHGGRVRTVAFGPDGNTLASAGHNGGVVTLWNVKEQKERITLKGHTDDVTCLAFSHDSATLASGSIDSAIRLWDAATAKEIATLVGHKGPVYSLAFAPDGKTLVSTGADHFVHLWDMAKGKERSALAWPGGFPRCVAFSMNGDAVFAAGAGGDFKQWGQLDHKGDNDPPPEKLGGNPLAFSQDGISLATGGMDGPIQIWEVATRRARMELRPSFDLVQAFAITNDGKFAAAAELLSGTIFVWDTVSGKKIAILIGHEQPVYALGFSSDGKMLASGSKDASVRLWSLPSSKTPEH
jgi:WD40 repeat protein